jgi:Ran GTPase-activating protein (RanGAP) involved in mRNA processing and transport
MRASVKTEFGASFDVEGVPSVRRLLDGVLAYMISISGKLKRRELVDIARSLQENQSVGWLEFQRCLLGDADVAVITEALARKRFVTKLVLNSNNFHEEGAKAIGKLLANNKKLESLHVHDNPLGDPGVIALAQALAENTTLIELNLSNTGFRIGGAAALCAALSVTSTLTSLHLNGNVIGDDGAAKIAEVLADNGTLRQLAVRETGFSHRGAADLAAALSRNSTLIWLDMGRNYIGDEGATAIAAALRVSTARLSLRIDQCRVGCAGATAIADALCSNMWLTSLSVFSNGVTDDGARAFARMLTKNSTLILLHMEFTEMTDVGARAIARALRKNETLRELSLDGSIDARVKSSIHHRLERNKRPRPERPAVQGGPPLSKLRARYTSRQLRSSLSHDMTVERAVVEAAGTCTVLRDCAAAVTDCEEASRTVMDVQKEVLDDRSSVEERDVAVRDFTRSFGSLEEHRASLVALSPPQPTASEMVASGVPLTIEAVDRLATRVSAWMEEVQTMIGAARDERAAACDAFVALHDKVDLDLTSKCVGTRIKADRLCREQSRAVEQVIARKVEVPPSPLDGMAGDPRATVVVSLHLRRLAILVGIARLQEYKRELESDGDACPSTAELSSLRKQLKEATRKVERLDMVHQHAVEDGDETGEKAAWLELARGEQGVASRAFDAEWLRLSLASTRWPELRLDLGDEVTTARRLADFGDRELIAPGPPATRFRVVKGTAPDGTRVALKMFPLGEALANRPTAHFMREAERLRRLRFAHVVQVRDAFVYVEGSQRFGVLELLYYGRGDMRQWLEGGEPRASPPQIRSVLRDALLGLAFCHGEGVVHADVKPANIFIGDDGTAVLGDFDILYDEEGADVAWTAPELRVVGARPTKASDVFAFGKTVEFARDRLTGSVSQLLTRCTAVRPGDRCRAEEALGDAFFRGAGCRPEEWASADCVVGRRCRAARQWASAGVHCASGHFVCRADLEALVASCADEVKCPDVSCSTPLYDTALLAATVSWQAFALWIRARDGRTEAALAAAMRRGRLGEEGGALEDTQRHADTIIDLLNDNFCPRCRTTFEDFDGCTVRACPRPGCDCCVCASCFSPAEAGPRSMVERHVAQCPKRPAYARASADPLYTSFSKWTNFMASRSRRRATQYMDRIQSEPAVRAQVEARLLGPAGPRPSAKRPRN